MVTDVILTALYVALAVLSAALAIRAARTAREALEDMRGQIGRMAEAVTRLDGKVERGEDRLSVMEGYMKAILEDRKTQGEELSQIAGRTEKILDQMDEIASAAALTDRVTQGMNNLMNYSGSAARRGE